MKGEKKKILIVDDEPELVFFVVKRLEHEGYKVISVNDGAIALEKVKQNGDISLLITDLYMPGINGYTLTKNLKKDPKHNSMPIIMISTMSQEKFETDAYKAGVNYYLRKPYEPKVLLDKVKELLGENR